MKEIYKNFKMRVMRKKPFSILHSPFSILLLFLHCSAQVFGQGAPSLVWREGFPGQTPANLVVLGDTGTIHINATLFTQNLENPKVEVRLPAGFEFARADGSTTAPTTARQCLRTGVWLTPATDFTTGTASNTTRILTMNYNKNANKLLIGDSLVIDVVVKATCAVNLINPGNITIEITASNYSTFLGYTRSFIAGVVKPTLRLIPDATAINFAKIDTTMIVTLNVDAQNGYVNSTVITLTYNATIITLDSFKIDGKLLPVTTSTTAVGVRTSGTSSATTTIRINEAWLLGQGLNGKISNIPHALTFRAASHLGCLREITTAIQYPMTGTACGAWTTSTLSLNLPGSTTLPTYTVANQTLRTISRFNFLNPENLNLPADPIGVNDFNYVCWNGTTPGYISTVFTNNNNTPTAFFQTIAGLGNTSAANSLQWCEYIDTAQVYYRVTARNTANTADSIVIPLTRLRGITPQSSTYVYPNDPVRYAPELRGKYRYITILLPISNNDPLPAGAKIEIEWVMYGNPAWNLASNRDKTTFTAYHDDANLVTCRLSTTYYGNSCGGKIEVSPNQSAYSQSRPRFYYAAQSQITVRPGESYTYSNQTNTGNSNINATTNPTGKPTGPRYAEYFVKMPDWLDLDTTTNIESAFSIGTTAPAAGSGGYHGSAGGYKTYSVRYYGNYTGLFNVRLKPRDCSSSECLLIDTIQVWADWVSGTPETACRPRFAKTTKLYSLVELNCVTPAFKIDDFGVFRQTRGLRDSLDRHDPDDGTLARDNEISHWRFLQGDTGYYYLKGVVSGNATNVYNTLATILKYETGGLLIASYQYLWSSTAATAGHTVPLWNNATIEVKRLNSDGVTFTVSTLPLTIPNPAATSVDSLMVYYNGNIWDYPLQGGDSCFLKIPFYCRLGLTGASSGANVRGSIFAKTYGIKTINQECKNEDSYYTSDYIKVIFRNFGLDGTVTRTATAFNSVCQSQELIDFFARAGFEGDEIRYWSKEVRFTHKLEKIVLRVPCGYVRSTNKIIVQPFKYMTTTTNWVAATLPEAQIVPDLAEEDFATGDSIFTIDMTKYYDYSYNGSQKPAVTYNPATGLLSNGKFFIGDDNAGANCRFRNLIATPAVNRTALTGTFYFTNALGTAQNYVLGTTTLVYNGARLSLQTAPKSLMVNSQDLALSSVVLQNPHTIITNNKVWLYLKGNVEDAVLVNQSTGVVTTGTGLNNCWLEIGNISPLEIQSYSLYFSYKGKHECVNDTMVLYSVFNADGTLVLDINQSIEQVPACNRGVKQYTILDVTTPKTAIAGKIDVTIPNPFKPGHLHHQSAYTVDYTINGKVSQGALNDPYVIIHVPAGQVYVDTTSYGAATFEYPVGTFNPIPPAVLAAMDAAIGTGSNDMVARDFTIYAKDLMDETSFMLPGWGADPFFGFTDLDRLLKIRIPFVPTCETDLTGIQFQGIFHGKTACNKPCIDDGLVFVTPYIFTDVITEYSFQVGLKNINIDRRTYTPDYTLDTLVATFTKELGVYVELIKAGDYVRLRLPEVLEVNGAITCPQFGGKIINVQNETLIDHERIYKLDLPITELNTLLLSAQDDSTFLYYIPIKYTPDPSHDCSAPRHELMCQVVTNASFDVNYCGDRPVSIGHGRVLILTINFDEQFFYACLNTPTTLSFACGGVTPVWYYNSTANAASQLAVGNTYIYTPTVQRDTTFYIRAYYDLGNYNGMEEDFGIAPVTVHMYPEVKADFTADTVCIGNITHFTNNSTVGGLPSDLTNTYKWYWYLNSSTTPFDSAKNTSKVLINGDIVKLKVISDNGCISQKSVTVRVRPLPVPAISGATQTCFRECEVYKTEVGMSNYVWSVNNGVIQDGITHRDSVKICWNVLPSPTPGYVKVTYTDTHGCASVLTDSLSVTLRKTPSTAVILGDANPCVNETVTYNFETQSGISVTHFAWNVTGGDIVAGGTTVHSYVTVNWKTLGAKKITLFVSNSDCVAPDTGRLTINVQGPDRPIISGTDSLCTDIYTGTDTYNYTTQTGLSTYAWHVEGGAIVSGGTAHEVTVRWNSYGTGRLAVTYSDGTCTTFSLDTFKVKVIPCDIMDCSSVTNKFVMEDSYGAGHYTHLDASWDLVPVFIPAFDSVTYYVGGLLHRSGPAATLAVTTLPVGVTTHVMCIAHLGGVSDTCEFDVKVRAACPTTIVDNPTDNNTYDVVDLAGLCWTTNLKATVYADGVTPIAWAKPYYSPEYPNTAYNANTFGLLYTWYSAVRVVPEGDDTATPDTNLLGFVQGICPDGWHIPSEAEWNLLNAYPAADLKSTALWINGTGTNLTGFNAVPAGMCDAATDKFINLYGETNWWSTDGDITTTNYFYLAYYCDIIKEITTKKGDGLSVRCVMD